MMVANVINLLVTSRTTNVFDKSLQFARTPGVYSDGLQ